MLSHAVTEKHVLMALIPTPVSVNYTGADCEVDIDECLLMEIVCSGHGNCMLSWKKHLHLPAHVILATLHGQCETDIDR